MLTRDLTVETSDSGGYVLGVYGDALAAAASAFEAAGSYGNGPAWTALAEHLLGMSPKITGITLDDEGDAFFAFANEERGLQELRARLIDTVSDENKLRDAIAAARARGPGRADL